MSSVGGIGTGGTGAYGSMSGSSGTAANDADTDKKFKDMLSGGGTSSSDRTANAEKTLKEITTGGFKGYWAWKIKQIKAQVTQEVMGSMNLTPQQLAAMPASQRADVERKIMRIVEQKVREMLKQQGDGKTGGQNGTDPTGTTPAAATAGGAGKTAASGGATTLSQGAGGAAQTASGQGNGGLTGDGTAASGTGTRKNKWASGIPALSSSVLSTLLTTQEIRT